MDHLVSVVILELYLKLPKSKNIVNIILNADKGIAIHVAIASCDGIAY